MKAKKEEVVWVIQVLTLNEWKLSCLGAFETKEEALHHIGILLSEGVARYCNLRARKAVLV